MSETEQSSPEPTVEASEPTAEAAEANAETAEVSPEASADAPTDGPTGDAAPAAEASNGASAGGPSEADVYEALEEVIDPELGLDFVSLGLVYDVEVETPEVYVTFTLTTPACPIGPQVSEQMKEYVGELEGVEKVHPKMIFDPPWSPEMMTEDAKFALGF